MHRTTMTACVLAALTLLAACSSGSDTSGDPPPSGSEKPSATTSETPSESPADPDAVDPNAIGPKYFGVHDADPVGSWPDAPVGSLRVWDAGAAWSQIETSPGAFDFSRLDSIVAAARAHDAETLIVLGQTPKFHATKPSPKAAYGPGASSMPTIKSWRQYVKKVAERYHAKDVQFQVWNEANVINYWSGTTAQMARLTAVAYDTIKKVDQDSVVVAPALATRLETQVAWFDDFYGKQVDGRPVNDMIDVVSLQLYPLPDKPSPEESMRVLDGDKKILAKHGVDKPIWNTEINYGLQGGKPVEQVPDKVQASNVAKTYLLSAANGAQRTYWYSWDLSAPIANTYTVEADLVTTTQAGRSYRTVQKWMVGTTVRSCTVDAQKTWTCTLSKGAETRRVYWNRQEDTSVPMPEGATTVEPLIGTVREVGADTSLAVGAVPVLVTSTAGGTAGTTSASAGQ